MRFVNGNIAGGAGKKGGREEEGRGKKRDQFCPQL